MKENIEVLSPFLIIVGYGLLLWLILRGCGLTWIYWEVTPERVQPWRRLRPWQFVIVHGMGTVTAPLLLLSLSRDFLERRGGVYNKPSTRHVVAWLIVCVLVGVWFGWSTWKKMWQHKYDLPD